MGGGGLEYSGGQGLRGVLPTPGLLVNGSFLSMLMEVKRFHRRARALLDNTDPSAPDQTLGVFLRSGRFSDYFTAHFMTPLVSQSGRVIPLGPEISRAVPVLVPRSPRNAERHWIAHLANSHR